ncbi:hypothetical protein [Polyangium jinanense]|uniref:DUF4240 domain-containing protein n=1 Tax=Polyangium jinanense TaxID=2829994 RepID=A0A9X4AVB1_9BACT|nr:hypothetical protein [Polyangium jinanense]MDC3959495.1 hypothetical protein [Polyangium jinanense]MDC3986093.1 hypothetical protein [Polyangium jinanense]
MDALVVWICALEAGYVLGEPWRAWAERRIEELPSAPPWLVQLMDASDAREALHACWEGAAETANTWSGVDGTALRLGFLWLRHAEGRIALADLLKEAGRVADAANHSAPSCEAFYLLLDEMDGGGPVDLAPGPGTVDQRAALLFAQHAQLARYEWEEIAGA